MVIVKDVLEKELSVKPSRVGEIVEGKVVANAKSAVFLDLGAIGTGIIYGREFLEAKDKIKNLKIGDSLFAKVVDVENEDGYIELSANSASSELTWERLIQKKDSDEIVLVKILGANKGGLLSEISGLPAFLPVSQLDSSHYPRVENGDPQKILEELQKFIGQELAVKIFDLKPGTDEIIISEKAKETEKIKEILKGYNVGDIVEGEITGLTDFGAFMRFGKEGLEGLIHISELDWKIIEDPSEVVKVGDKVKAKVIDIAKDKVSFSLKALKEDPWKNIEEKYKKGDAVEGKAVKFNPFGAFVQIGPEIQGLIHISEFGTKAKMEEALEIGKNYKFEILTIEPKEHRMSLKLAA